MSVWVSVEFISWECGNKGTANEAGTLSLLLKLQMQRDLHGNESVCWSLTQLQMARKQISISFFNHLVCFIFWRRWDEERGLDHFAQPDKLQVNCNNNEALMDKWSAFPNSCLVMISFAHLTCFFQFLKGINRTRYLPFLFNVFFLIKTWCHVFLTPRPQILTQMTSRESIYQSSAAL